MKDNQACVFAYLNWWICSQSRYRIAGKEAKSFYKKSSRIISEVVLIPIKPELEILDIACCSQSGNLAISHGHLISLHQYIKVSKLKSSSYIYYDFCPILNVSLSFFSTQVALVENYLAFVSYKHIEIIKLLVDTDQTSNLEFAASSKFEQSEEECTEWNLDTDDVRHSVVLPSLFSNQSTEGKQDKPLLEITGPIDSNLLNPFAIKLQLANDLCSPNIIRANYEILLHLDCFSTIVKIILTPTYRELPATLDPLTENVLSKEKIQANPLLSTKHASLHTLTFFASSKSKGFSYRIEPLIKKIDEYCYQNQMKSIIIENNYIHALTHNYLDTFNNRSLYFYFGFQATASPSLLNSRPFFNTLIMLNSVNYIILISKSEAEVHTIYLLKRPTIDQILEDVHIFLSNKINGSKPTIDLYQHIIVLLRSQKYFYHSLSPSHQKSLIMYSYKLVHQLMKDLKSNYYDSIGYVYEQDDTNIQDIIDRAKNNFSFISNYLRIKAGQNLLVNQKLNNINLKQLSDIDLVTKIVLDVQFENLQNLRSLFNHFDDRFSNYQLILLKLKIAFDLNELDLAQKLLLHVTTDHLLEYHHSFIPIRSFSEWILNQQPDLYFTFLLTCITTLKYPLQTVVQMFTKEEHVLKVLDMVYWSNRQHFPSSLVYDLLTLYFKAIQDKHKSKSITSSPLPREQSWLKNISPPHCDQDDNQCVCFDCCPLILKLISVLFSNDVTKCNFSQYILKNLHQLNNVQLVHLFNLLLKPFLENLEAMWDTKFDSIMKIAEFQANPENWRVLISKALALNDSKKLELIIARCSQTNDPLSFIKYVPKNGQGLLPIHVDINYKRYQVRSLEAAINVYVRDNI